jgi:hypothetical protein
LTGVHLKDNNSLSHLIGGSTMQYRHNYSGINIKTADTFSLKEHNCLLKGSQITSDKTIELYSLSFLDCQNSKLSAPTIYLPYRDQVSLKGCQLNGKVLYLDLKQKQAHEMVSYRFFEGGDFLIDMDHLKSFKGPEVTWEPREASDESDCTLPDCKLINGIPHDKNYLILPNFRNDGSLFRNSVPHDKEATKMSGEHSEPHDDL